MDTHALSNTQREDILQLIYKQSGSEEERENLLNELESATESDAEEMIRILSAFALIDTL